MLLKKTTINVRWAENVLYKSVINVAMHLILEDVTDRDEMP